MSKSPLDIKFSDSQNRNLFRDFLKYLEIHNVTKFFLYKKEKPVYGKCDLFILGIKKESKNVLCTVYECSILNTLLTKYRQKWIHIGFECPKKDTLSIKELEQIDEEVRIVELKCIDTKDGKHYPIITIGQKFNELEISIDIFDMDEKYFNRIKENNFVNFKTLGQHLNHVDVDEKEALKMMLETPDSEEENKEAEALKAMDAADDDIENQELLPGVRRI